MADYIIYFGGDPAHDADTGILKEISTIAGYGQFNEFCQ